MDTFLTKKKNRITDCHIKFENHLLVIHLHVLHQVVNEFCYLSPIRQPGSALWLYKMGQPITPTLRCLSIDRYSKLAYINYTKTMLHA